MKKKPTPISNFQNKIPAIIRILVVALLIMCQIAFMFWLTDFLKKETYLVYCILEVISMSWIVFLVDKKCSWTHKLGWVIIVMLLPVTGFVMYLLWGSNYTNYRLNKKIVGIISKGQRQLKDEKKVKEVIESLQPQQKRIAKYLNEKDFSVYNNTHMDYFSLGDMAYRSIIEDIKKAEEYILLEFFIVAEGRLWDEIHEILVKKVKQGVDVRLLYDDWGSIITVPNTFPKELAQEGIKVSIFNPVQRYLSKLYMNYRNHQKVIVIDGKVGYTGGINLADEYVNYYPKHGHWKDQAIRLEGEGVFGLTLTFLEMWEVSSGEHIKDYSIYKKDNFIIDKGCCQPFSDGPANNPSNPARDTFVQIMNLSEKYLYITSPYVVIDTDVLDALSIAAHSGVDVRLITPNIPDHKYVQLITKYNYGRLIEAGVKIYEYTPGFMHAKMIINESTGVIGSINIDYRSFYLHYECGVVIYEKRILEEAKNDFLKTLEVCDEITYEEWKRRPLMVKAFQLVLNLFSGLM